ncbi:MAG: DMT family transporter [Chitinophagales bacterium]
MNSDSRAYLFLHIAVFLWGVTAILGKLITYNEYILVWYRTALVSLSFLLLSKTHKGLKQVTWQQAIKIGGAGVIVAIHWIFFYGAIKYANVSIALSLMATVALMVSFIEPFITKRKFRIYEAMLGIAVIPGIYLIFYFSDTSYLVGIIMALLSAFFAALFTSLNKKFIDYAEPFSFSFLQILGAFIFLSVWLPVYLRYFPNAMYIGSHLDYTYLLILAIFCTTIPYILYVIALKKLDAFTTSLANNLEPVYGIILAWLIFQENKEMDNRFYIGTLIIILTIFLQPILKKRFGK